MITTKDDNVECGEQDQYMAKISSLGNFSSYWGKSENVTEDFYFNKAMFPKSSKRRLLGDLDYGSN